MRGTIRNSTGAAVANATVRLFQGATQVASLTTEPDGTYLFLPTSEGGPLGTGVYQIQPQPPGQFICPSSRSVTVSATSAIVANFTSRTTACQVNLLVVSGGDVQTASDTTAVKALFANAPGITTRAFFFVNQTPGLAFLNQFDVVLLFANGQFNESVTLGSEIASYVQAGGNLVIGSFYWQNRSDSNLGSSGWGSLESIDPFRSLVNPQTGVGGATYQSATLGTVTTGDVPTQDRLVQGVTSLSSTGFRGGAQANTGTTVVARWSDNTALVGYRILAGGQRLVAISLFPASGAAASGNVTTLWTNAVRWTGEAGGPGS